MMLSKKMQNMLNEQVNAEFYSAYLYLSMVAYFESINLPGFAAWMLAQSQEEVVHAMKIFNHIHERGGRVELSVIETPTIKWSSPLQAFESAYAHEQKVSGLINNLVKTAISENDHASNIFLQWFVTEQVEEEKSADEIVQKLKRSGDSPGVLLMLDREMGQRTFTMPADNTM